MTSIQGMHREVKKETQLDLNLNEMVFYSGSPNPSILVVSEAPTLPSNRVQDTLYSDISEKYESRSEKELYSYLRGYPFKDKKWESKRNSLYTQFIEKILAFVNAPREEIGFTDASKIPLEKQAFQDRDKFIIDYQNDVLKKQIEYTDPDIVIGNKKNVSRKLSKIYIREDPAELDFDDKKARFRSDGKAFFLSMMAHRQLDNFSKKRLSNSVAEEYNETL